MLALLLAVVIDTAPAAVTPSDPPAPPHVCLHPPADSCDTRASHDEMVVCGSPNQQGAYRLRQTLPAEPEGQWPQAQAKLGDGALDLHGENREIADHVRAARAMIGFTHPF